MKKYRFLVLGGTFDHLHKGHKKLIDKALELGEKLIIGLADRDLIKNKFLTQTIESYSARLNNLKKYLSLKKSGDRVKILKIKDIFGTTLTDKKIEAILVTSQTYANSLIINQERKKRGLSPLKIITYPLILADDGKLISSEQIRAGEIDSAGKSYQLIMAKYFGKKERLVLPEYLRDKLREPLGKVFAAKEDEIENTGKILISYLKKKNPPFVFTVGDVVSYSLVKNGFFPNLKIIDHRAKREKIPQKMKNFLNNHFHFKIANEPGTINFWAVETIKKAVQKILTKNSKETVFVSGEEDLLVLPLILFSPLKTLIFYGHWQLGVVAVEVLEKKKHQALAILKKFI